MININEKINILKINLDKLISKDIIPCIDLTKEDLPESKGVYMFSNKSGEIVYIGIAGVKGKGVRTLQDRIWKNHINGKFKNSTLKRKLNFIENIQSPELAKEHILNNFDLRFLELDDNILIKDLEHFSISIFSPKYND